jgi:hypothetical protein
MTLTVKDLAVGRRHELSLLRAPPQRVFARQVPHIGEEGNDAVSMLTRKTAFPSNV